MVTSNLGLLIHLGDSCTNMRSTQMWCSNFEACREYQKVKLVDVRWVSVGYWGTRAESFMLSDVTVRKSRLLPYLCTVIPATCLSSISLKFCKFIKTLHFTQLIKNHMEHKTGPWAWKNQLEYNLANVWRTIVVQCTLHKSADDKHN